MSEPISLVMPATGETSLNPKTTWAAAPGRQAQGSVFVTGQVCSRDQRRGRYTRESLEHPGKMLPSIARYLIATFTEIGEWVCDPMAGIATTIVEAMHLGRRGIGVEYEARWARLAAGNIRLATTQGATGRGEILRGDSRHLPALIPPELHGRIALVITSPPYGPSTHGHARTPGPRRGKVRKINHRYGTDRDNLAYRDHDQLADGFTHILTGCAAILRPGGVVAVTARPYRHRGELIDIPGMVVAAGTNAGLRLHEECAALIAGIETADSCPEPRSSSRRTSAPPSPRATRNGSYSTRTCSCSSGPEVLEVHAVIRPTGTSMGVRGRCARQRKPAHRRTCDMSTDPRTANRRSWSIQDIIDLGATTDLVTAGQILGIGRTKSHALAREGKFPVPVIRHGRRYVVPVTPILELLHSAK